MRMGTEGYGGYMGMAPKPTLRTGWKGLAGLRGLSTSKCTGESWLWIKIPGPWSECCFQPRKNWTESSPADVLPLLAG